MNDATKQIAVTKLDAARRQLRTAIELWFNDGEPVSIHTLACAAYQIVHDLNKRKKGPPLWFDTDIVKDEHRKDFVRLVKASSNFFKHADLRKQQATSIEFKPATSDGFLLFAVVGLHVMGITINDIESAFMSWTLIHKPHFLKPEGRKVFFNDVPVDQTNKLKSIEKSEFFKAFLEVRREKRARGLSSE